MPNIPTLHIAEYQSFTQGDIESCFRNLGLDSAKCSQKAQKIFEELQEFAKQEGNGKFLCFSGRGTLKAQNYVGLIQTKSGFCVEILPKTFAGNNPANKDFAHDLCEYHKSGKGKASQKVFDKAPFSTKVADFVESIAQGELWDGGVPHRSGVDSKDNAESSSETKNPQSPIACPICESKQILLNCLATLRRDIPFEASHIASLHTLKTPLLEIFFFFFVRECESLLHKGLKIDYLEIAQNRAFLKGKLLFNGQIRHNLVHKERFFTSSDEYSSDTAPNRLIKATLELLHTLLVSPKTRTRLDCVYFAFEDISPSRHIESDFAKCQNMRRLREYKCILAWCALFLRQKSFSAYSGSTQAFALLFPMEQLFESFVAHWIARSARESRQNYQVRCQEKVKRFMVEILKDTPTQRIEELIANGLSRRDNEAFALQPDIVLRGVGENKGAIAILDTKWKIPDTSNDEKRYGISQSDVYQMWAYASKYARECAQSTESSDSLRSHITTWLIYPLCARTKEVQGKRWFFKASLPPDTANDTTKNASDNAPTNTGKLVSLNIVFFPLLQG